MTPEWLLKELFPRPNVMTLEGKKQLTDAIVALVESAGTNPKYLRDLFGELSHRYGGIVQELDREHAALFPLGTSETIPGGYI